MKLSTILLAAATLIVGFTFNIDKASAGERKERVDKRQQKQRKRIRNGVKSGELTRKEAKGLVKRQKRTRRMERRFKKDGDFTKKEKMRLESAQDRASKSIYKKKHNKRKRKQEQSEEL